MSSFAFLLSLLLSFGSSTAMLQSEVKAENRVKETKEAPAAPDHTNSIVIIDITTP